MRQGQLHHIIFKVGSKIKIVQRKQAKKASNESRHNFFEFIKNLKA